MDNLLAAKNYNEIVKGIDDSKWNSFDSLIFVTLSSSFFMWGITLSIAPLITTWDFIPSYMDIYIIAASPAGLLAGNLFLGSFSDKFGRKRVFLATVIFTFTGLLGISLSYNYYLILFFIFMAEFGLGGDETVSLAFLSEYIPKKYRGTALIESSNMANLGVTVMAAIFIMTASSVFLDKQLLVIISMVGFAIAITTRLKLKESVKWEYLKKNPDKNNKLKINKNEIYKFISLSFLGVAIIVGFAFSYLVLGPFEFPEYSGYIIFFSVLAETLTGIFGGIYMGRAPRKLIAIIGFSGLFILWLFVVILLKLVLLNIYLLIALLVISGIFGEFGWGAREMLEPENFHTLFRGRGIGSVRAIGYIVYLFTVFLLAAASIEQYAYYLLIIYFIGFAGSLIYLFKGKETKNENIY
ncbi:MFS transporter [Ferroplasma sp.]|uniref:MFS transporter n=1 Tax=Ferroplasma sp. TaxID=2591003 RepID=UPI00307F6E87